SGQGNRYAAGFVHIFGNHDVTINGAIDGRGIGNAAGGTISLISFDGNISIAGDVDLSGTTNGGLGAGGSLNISALVGRATLSGNVDVSGAGRLNYGGSVDLYAFGDVDAGSTSLNARGTASAAGGHVSVRSVTGHVDLGGDIDVSSVGDAAGTV